MKYVAFLRSLNVGGKHIVKMPELKKLFEELGFKNVATFIASGNVIFEAKSATSAKIEAALAKALGYEVRTFLRTLDELARIGETDDSDCTLYVGFFAKGADAEIKRKVKALSTPIDEVYADGTELYWLCRAQSFSDATVTGAQIEKALGQPVTIRNINTVRKIAAKYRS
jgi:uncharacterized protein (DUF1697 family)